MSLARSASSLTNAKHNITNWWATPSLFLCLQIRLTRLETRFLFCLSWFSQQFCCCHRWRLISDQKSGSTGFWMLKRHRPPRWKIFVNSREIPGDQEFLKYTNQPFWHRELNPSSFHSGVWCKNYMKLLLLVFGRWFLYYFVRCCAATWVIE